MKAYEAKQRRRLRRRNHIARDLQKPEFRQRKRDGKPKNSCPPEIDEWDDEDEREDAYQFWDEWDDEFDYWDEHIND
tara:strand:+ start:507 stop:737 length:231 start_codon:yes stop_codon:yes gene_type:complete